MEPEADSSVHRPMRRIHPTLIALGGLLLLLLIIWFFSTERSPDQDKLTGNQVSIETPSDSEKRCASKATYDHIKRELFRRAAQVRGSDQSAFDRLAAYAIVRMENPVMESENAKSGAVNCSGSLALDLPPGVAVVGGRRTLTADIDYTLQQAADDSGEVVLLRNADAIITPLATLARTAPPAQSAGDPDENAIGEDASSLPDTPPQAPPPTAPDEPRATASPSFNCANARTRGEVAVCADSGLAALDRQMAGQFNRALSGASPTERALLQQTRSRFLAYRDACRSDDCIADAYRGRMREIGDIMAGHWQPR